MWSKFTFERLRIVTFASRLFLAKQSEWGRYKASEYVHVIL